MFRQEQFLKVFSLSLLTLVAVACESSTSPDENELRIPSREIEATVVSLTLTEDLASYDGKSEFPVDRGVIRIEKLGPVEGGETGADGQEIAILPISFIDSLQVGMELEMTFDYGAREAIVRQVTETLPNHTTSGNPDDTVSASPSTLFYIEDGKSVYESTTTILGDGPASEDVEDFALSGLEVGSRFSAEVFQESVGMYEVIE